MGVLEGGNGQPTQQAAQMRRRTVQCECVQSDSDCEGGDCNAHIHTRRWRRMCTALAAAPQQGTWLLLRQAQRSDAAADGGAVLHGRGGAHVVAHAAAEARDRVAAIRPGVPLGSPAAHRLWHTRAALA